jgi:K+-transporting ATPase A subunit
MRRIMLLILPILVIIAIGFTIFGVFQVQFEEEKSLDDLKRKTRHIAESMELSNRS